MCKFQFPPLQQPDTSLYRGLDWEQDQSSEHLWLLVPGKTLLSFAAFSETSQNTPLV
jgi:hypothetical protein